MRRLATILSMGAAILFAADCAYDRYAPVDPALRGAEQVYDNARNLYACRAYNYEPRFCR